MERNNKILGATIGNEFRYRETFADTWGNAWADDGNLYCVMDDCYGWNQDCCIPGRNFADGKDGSNVAVCRVMGDKPYELTGETVAPFNKPGEFGNQGEVSPETCDVNWKGSGITCVDGVLYLSVSKHGHDPVNKIVQTSVDASILKSTDYGKNWYNTNNEKATARYSSQYPTFPGVLFSNPYYIDYGQDGLISIADSSKPHGIHVVPTTII